MDFAHESTNVPLDLSLDYIKKHGRLRMSASESIFFVRYFGLMIGEYIPEDNELWKLYIKLREIVNIITSPDIMNSHLLQLQILIEEHHKLYVKLFGPLKAKFHLLIHYVNIILRNGPTIIISAMRFESKHREIKSIVQSTSCKRNILKTIGVRHQLSLLHCTYSNYQKKYVTYGSEVRDDEVNYRFPLGQERKSFNKLSVNDVTYSSGTIFVADIYANGPCFAKIEKIFVVDNEIFFKYIPFKIRGFNNHYFAYSVVAESTQKLINYDSIASRVPCLLLVKKRLCILQLDIYCKKKKINKFTFDACYLFY